MTRTWAIPSLFAIHVLAALVTAYFSDQTVAFDIPMVTHFAVITCQGGLVGLWAGLGAAHWALRGIGMLAGFAVLGTVFSFGLGGID